MQIRTPQLAQLYDHLLNFDSVLLVGMRQVGIGGFIRSVLRAPTPESRMLYIHINFQALTEKTVRAFWALVYRRILETAGSSHSCKEQAKYQRYFVEWEHDEPNATTTQTLERLQKVLKELIADGLQPVLFMVRFDRILDAATPDFFDNLQAVLERCDKKVSYVLTSWRELPELKAEVFADAGHLLFTRTVFIPPFNPEESAFVLQKLLAEYRLTMAMELQDKVIAICGGHLQYLKLAVVIYKELDRPNDDAMLKVFAQDDRTIRMSGEIYDSLTPLEKKALEKVVIGKQITEAPSYLVNAGILVNTNPQKLGFFSLLFEQYVKAKIAQALEFEFESTLTAKEKLLFDYLKNHLGEVCERNEVFAQIWANSETASDWALDKLVARLRGKIAAQKVYILYTHKSRGFRLSEV